MVYVVYYGIKVESNAHNVGAHEQLFPLLTLKLEKLLWVKPLLLLRAALLD